MTPQTFPELRFFRHISVNICLLVMGVLAVSITVYGQDSAPTTASTSVPVPGAGHGYIGQANETVNPANGSVSIRIPVALPAGRKLNPSFTIGYDSGQVTTPEAAPHGPGFAQWRVPSGSYSQGGWSYRIPRLVVTVVIAKLPASEGGGSCQHIVDEAFFDSAGRVTDFKVNSSGNNSPVNQSCPGASVPPRSTVIYPGVAGVTVGIGNTPTVATADGTTYSFGYAGPVLPIASGSTGTTSAHTYYASLIEDTNGNKIVPTYPAYSDSYFYGGPFALTDTLGRTVASTSGFATPVDSISVSGLASPYKVTWSSVSAAFTSKWTQLVADPWTCSPPTTDSGSFSTVSSIQLPNGQSYSFSYDPTYGTLKQITYPSGGWVKYAWEVNSQSASIVFPDLKCTSNPDGSAGCNGAGSTTGCQYIYDKPVIQTRTVSFDGVKTALIQTFSYTTTWGTANTHLWTQKTTSVTTQDLIQGTSYTTKYTYTGNGDALSGGSFLGTGPGSDIQVPLEQTVTYGDTTGNTIKTDNDTWLDQYRLASKVTTLNTSSAPSQLINTWQPGSSWLLQESDEYDYGASSPTRKSLYQYQAFASSPLFPTAGYITNKLSQLLVEDGSNNPVSQTNYGYDTGSISTVTASEHDDTNYGAASTAPRGNITSVTKSCLQGCASPLMTLTYDDTGQIASITDPCGNAPCADMSGTSHTTMYTFNDNYSSGTPPSNTNGYLTKITDSLGHSTSFSYGYNDGQLTRSTDANGNSTSYKYNTPPSGCSFPDGLDRLSEIDYPDSGQTTHCYKDSGPSPSVTTNQLVNAAGSTKTSISVLDGLGHVVQTELVTDPSGADYSNIAYNGENRTYTVQNLHRAGASYGTTTFVYDALGRETVESEPDGNHRTWSYSNNLTTSKDEAGHTWIRTTDALGRLTNVTEPTGASTAYLYDLLDNLVTVTQSGVSGETPRGRSFKYDSLSRLLQAYNPETGWNCYGTTPSAAVPNGSNCTAGTGYDQNGNLQYKTDARGVVMYYSYDVLNRLTQKDTTASVGGWVNDQYAYDGPWPNDIGRLSSMGTFGTGTQFTYDSMGRIVSTQEATRNIPWSSGFKAVYDLAGNLSSLTYPDGRQVTQVWDGAGHLATVTSPAGGQSGGFTYLSGPSSVGGMAYTADGAESAFVLGAGVVQSNTYNNRLQLCQTQVGTVLPGSSQATSVLNKNYFHALTPETLCQNATGNNGNIWSIADIQKPTLSQSLTYDSLNRLLSASSTDYVQINSFDSFGNMILQNNNKSPLSYSINPLTNQLLRNNTDFQYDAAGNLQVVVNAFATETYSSNALGQLEAVYSGNDPKNFYYYNANDLRSTKTVGTSSIDYEYFNGQLMAELSSDGTWTDHIYANGKKIASASNSDVRSHLSGIIPASGPTPFAQCSMAAPLYPVKTGDQLAFRMYERNASAGVSLLYGDGTNSDASCGTDQYGECLKQEATAGSWVNRVVNLGAVANGKTLNSLILWNNAGAPTGQFDVMFADMSITSVDGTVTQLIGETATGAYSSNGSSGITNLSCVSEKVTSKTDFAGVPQTIRYYVGDQVGTAQLELTSGGWPIWKGEFNPFGGEIDPETTSNNYKFTGKERDTESGFDYFGARYYGSDVGRFISPDRMLLMSKGASTGIVFQTYIAQPQNWNRYTYVRNNPLSFVDPDGMETQVAIFGRVSDNVFGHAALIVNGKVYSYGTNETGGAKGKRDWGADAKTFLDAEAGKRQGDLLTLKLTPDQEKNLQQNLDSHNPNAPGAAPYSICNGNSCVNQTANPLEAVGALVQDVTVGPGGAPIVLQPITPNQLENQLQAQPGLVESTRTIGKPTTGYWASLWNTVRRAL